MSLFRNLLIEKKRKPYYCEVEYLQSSGTQYIDTGIHEDTTCIINMQATQTTNTTQVVLGNVLEGTRTKWFGTAGNTNYYTVGGSTGASSISATTRKECVITFTDMYSTTSSSVSFYFKDNPSTVYTRSDTVSGGITLTNILVGSFASAYPSYFKLYGLKIYNTNNVLLRDFIPVLDWNYTPCMYDRVSRKLFYNQGTGTFTYGREIHYVDYLEATGTQYINTGLLSTANSQVDVEFGFTSMESGATNNCAIFGGRNNTTTYTFTLFKLASTNPQKFRFDYNNQVDVATASQLTWNTASKYRFQYTGSQHITTNITTGESVSAQRSPGSSFTSTPIALFAVNTNGTYAQNMSGRIYKYWYTDGTNTIDLSPAIDENGVGFMFDAVTHTIFDNAGTGNFKYPPVELTYLVADGNQYIDTGLQPTDSFGYKSKNTYTLNGGEQIAIGCMDAGNRFVGIYVGGSGANISGGWGSYVGYVISQQGTWDSNTIFEVSCNYKNDRKITWNGQDLMDLTDTHISGTISNSIYLMARHYGTNVTKMSGKFYGAEITNGSNVIRDFIPCFKDGSAGMYDKENGVFYGNQGSGSFGTGKVVESRWE